MEYRKGILSKIGVLDDGKEAIYDEPIIIKNDESVFFEPKEGSPCYVGSIRTTPVNKIISSSEESVTFHTKNSIYKLDYK